MNPMDNTPNGQPSEQQAVIKEEKKPSSLNTAFAAMIK
jgi:hypothetical protein